MKRNLALGAIVLSLSSIFALGGCGHAPGGDASAQPAADLRAEDARPLPIQQRSPKAAQAKVTAPRAPAAEIAKAAPAAEAKLGDDDTARCDHDNKDVEPPDNRVEKIDAGASPSRGPEAAEITVVVFSDFQCPFCRKAEATVRELEAAYPGKVRYVWKNHPLPFHEHAHLAARAALAAAEQGKFWEYHDALFLHQDALDRASLERYADDVGLDLRRFRASLDDARVGAAVDADDAEAERLEVKGTPTFFVNGHRVIGAQPLAKFKEQADAALAAR
jgi:protein-disulfide isomerase